MNKYKIRVLLAIVVAVFGMTSCSEEDNTVEEYADWQAKNEAYFNNLSDSVTALLAADPSRTDWKRIKTWSKDASTEGSKTDYIIVHVVDDATPGETDSPLYSDVAQVSYIGRLLPSRTYPSGYVFDSTFDGVYDKDISASTELTIGNASGNSLIDGFATALQHMRRGERWTVYIPHQLGYGATSNSAIPAYSTLIFDIVLVDFHSPGYGD